MDTTYDMAWVAGVLEGEACFDGNRKPEYPRMRVTMTDLDVLERIVAIFEHHGIKCNLGPTKKREPHHKDAWELRVTNVPSFKALALHILPWLGERRKEKVEELLAAVKAR